MSPPGPAFTLGAARRALAARLAQAGIEDSAHDSRALMEAATGLAPAAQAAEPERTLTNAQAAALEAMAARRASGEPLQHITGRADFWTLRLKSDSRALVPRQDTEAVVAAALEHLPPDRPARVLDFGTGSGAILLAVLSERPRAFGIGLDRSAEALSLARENAALTGLSTRAAFLLGDWDGALGDAARFDLVVSNPPYVRSAEIAGLQPEVLRDPHAALDGGPDGLAPYRRLIPALPRLLAPGGAAVFEIGADQADDITRIARAVPGLAFCGVRPDLEGRPRAAVFGGSRPDAGGPRKTLGSGRFRG